MLVKRSASGYCLALAGYCIFCVIYCQFQSSITFRIVSYKKKACIGTSHFHAAEECKEFLKHKTKTICMSAARSQLRINRGCFFRPYFSKNKFWDWTFKSITPQLESALPRYHVFQFPGKINN